MSCGDTFTFDHAPFRALACCSTNSLATDAGHEMTTVPGAPRVTERMGGEVEENTKFVTVCVETLVPVAPVKPTNAVLPPTIAGRLGKLNDVANWVPFVASISNTFRTF